MSPLKFLAVLALIVAMLYHVVKPAQRKGLFALAAVIAVVFIIMNKDESTPMKAKYPIPSTHGKTSESAASEAITDSLTGVTLPQVDVLGRNIDDKMAMNQTASRVVVPGGVNAVFENSVVAEGSHVGVPQPSEGSFVGAPL